MNVAIRDAVRKRARDRRGYCRIPQDDAPFLRHQIEHVVPRQYGSDDSLANLALACYRCNKFNGPNLSAFDPRTAKVV
jgi:5-methylcytosine-specific restriction endonuclease McrA